MDADKKRTFNGMDVSPARSAAADAMLSFLGKKASTNMPSAFFTQTMRLLPGHRPPNPIAQRIRSSFSPLRHPPILTNSPSAHKGILVSTPLYKLRGENVNVSTGETFDGFLSETTKSGRKEKSLGLLCQKFLLLYSTLKQSYVSLDIAAKNLGVERRRMYDVVNVLESISIVSKRAKNCYCWHGYEGIQARILEIKNTNENDAPPAGEVVESNDVSDSARRSLIQLHFANRKKSSLGLGLSLPVSPITSTATTHSVAASSGERKEKRKKGKDNSKGGVNQGPSRRLKSLGRLSCRFISLFLNYKPVLSLEEAAKNILKSRCGGGDVTVQLLRTKIRRLYDVANILSSIGMIVKCKITKTDKVSEGGLKPAFKWVGSINEVFNDPQKVSDQLEVLNLVDGIVEDPADAKYRSVDEKEATKVERVVSPVPAASPCGDSDGRVNAGVVVDNNATPDVALSQSSSKTKSVRAVVNDALLSKMRSVSRDIPKQEAARLSRASSASVRAANCGESFRAIWDASADGVGLPPEPYIMLRFQQAQLKEFMRNYCNQWHDCKQNARDRDLKRAACSVTSESNDTASYSNVSKKLKENHDEKSARASDSSNGE